MTNQRHRADQCLCNVTAHNLTGVVEFLLLGLSEDPELQSLLFCMFLTMYLICLMGNLLILLAVSSDPHLHTPMYFFLSILSVADIGFISTTVPKMVSNIQTQSKIISYTGCLTQVSLFNLFGCVDSTLLASMAYDRFVAICHPLHYSVIMNPCLCNLLVLVSLFISLLDSQINFMAVSQLTFCPVVEIPHFFCDPPQLLKCACDSTFTSKILMYLVSAVFGGIPLSCILFSYTRIISSIMRVPSTGGKYKVFSTCGSHLSVVCLYYGTGVGLYLSSLVSQSPGNNAVISVAYSVVVPILNPFVYSLRNKDIKKALQRLLNRTV